jgi:hypothetical protein
VALVAMAVAFALLVFIGKRRGREQN